MLYSVYKIVFILFTQFLSSVFYFYFLESEVRSPRFTGSGWLAFPALRAAYKHVQLELEFRPEAWDGILLLAGERDDLQGDFMALILHHGFVEFR